MDDEGIVHIYPGLLGDIDEMKAAYKEFLAHKVLPGYSFWNDAFSDPFYFGYQAGMKKALEDPENSLLTSADIRARV